MRLSGLHRAACEMDSSSPIDCPSHRAAPWSPAAIGLQAAIRPQYYSPSHLDSSPILIEQDARWYHQQIEPRLLSPSAVDRHRGEIDSSDYHRAEGEMIPLKRGDLFFSVPLPFSSTTSTSFLVLILIPISFPILIRIIIERYARWYFR